MVKSPNVAFFVAAVGLAACSSSSGHRPGAAGASDPSAPEAANAEPAAVGLVQSALQRDANPQLSDSERDSLSASQIGFAVDLYHAVRNLPQSAGQDILLSPHSISVALAMTYAGARGDTAAEMKRALHFVLPDDRLHTGLNYLDLTLASHATGDNRLDVANSIWGQKGSSFETPFLDTLAVNYGAGLNVVDFMKETEGSRLAINRWVEDKTESRIKDLLPRGVLTSDTRMVLVNAVYFNMAWADAFEPDATATAPFTKLDGSTVDVPMMHKQSSRPYASGQGYDAVEMAYQGDALALLVIVPAAGTFDSFESSLTGSKVLDIMDGLQSKKVSLSFPKLRIEGEFSLNEPLKQLGMQKAFDDGADFSGMTSTEHLSVSDVLHKTFAEITEKGTEAAAATGVGTYNSSATVAPELKVDRPFITAIVDRPTKTLLFLGRVLEPKP